ncbi:hypothetical protein B0G93_11570 [Bacillus sp. V-88]|nr:hypothetical protein B1B00_14635 [Bacillus sp. DSM 27956]PRX75288.1 hypothetical protein B0G93_11570 [Bacillus sp. V-88]SLK23739.1 hypothetical protein SAMN06295884_11570 [Bacillus sp. V-88]
MGGLFIFVKKGEIKEVINTQVKTIFDEGKFNFSKLILLTGVFNERSITSPPSTNAKKLINR